MPIKSPIVETNGRPSSVGARDVLDTNLTLASFTGKTRADRYKQWLQTIVTNATDVRYASLSGSTGNDGSRASPWPLQFGMNQMTAGGVLIVLDGVYTTSAGDALLDCGTAGTASAYITVAAENLHGARLNSTSKLFGIRVNTGAHYVRIAGFEITGVSNSGIISYADHTQALYNYIHSTTPIESVDGGAGITYVSTGAQTGGLIEGNHIHDIGDFDTNTWGNGTSPSTRVHGIYTYRTNVTIINNLVYRIKAFGITFWRNPKNNIVANNTIYLCKYGAISVGAGDVTGALAENNIIVNNIAAHSYFGLDEVGDTGTNTFDRNLVWSNTANLSLQTSTATNLVTADPLLIEPGRRGDYRPRFTSPVRRAASSTYIPTLDFNLLPYETVDIGCFGVREEDERQVKPNPSFTFWSLPIPLPPGFPNTTTRPAIGAIVSTGTTALAQTANRAYWMPFAVTRTIRIITLTTEVTTAAAGTHTLYIYSANSIGQPLKRLASGTLDAGTTGTKTITLNLPLEPGIYYCVWLATSAATVRALAVSGAYSLGHTVGGTVNNTHFFTTGTPPDPAPTSGYTSSGASVPLVGVEYVM